MTISDALPDRPVSQNELFALESHDGIRITMPQSAPAFEDIQSVECVMIVGEGQTVAMGFDEAEETWKELRREPTPDDAFTGDFITNNDHDSPAIQRIREAMKEWTESA